MKVAVGAHLVLGKKQRATVTTPTSYCHHLIFVSLLSLSLSLEDKKKHTPRFFLSLRWSRAVLFFSNVTTHLSLYKTLSNPKSSSSNLLFTLKESLIFLLSSSSSSSSSNGVHYSKPISYFFKYDQHHH